MVRTKQRTGEERLERKKFISIEDDQTFNVWGKDKKTTSSTLLTPV